MDKFFPIDLYQTLSYLMPGLALFLPIYLVLRNFIDPTLEKLGSITVIVLLVPVCISLGIFLHAASTSAQFQIEKAVGHNMIKSATTKFAHYDVLRDRIGKTYSIELKQDDNFNVYAYSRTMIMKDGGALKDRAQFFVSLSVFCRSLILVSLIVGATVIWFTFGKNRAVSLGAMAALMVFVLLLVYFKEMYFQLSIDEILRAALLLTAPKGT
jgi:hypothetical protein